jgi:hypothetical protein
MILLLPYRCTQTGTRLSPATHLTLCVGAALGVATIRPVTPLAVLHLALCLLVLRTAARPIEWRLGALALAALVVAGAGVTAIVQGTAPAGLTAGALAGVLGAHVALFARDRVRWLYWAVALFGTAETSVFALVAFAAAEQALAALLLGPEAGAAALAASFGSVALAALALGCLRAAPCDDDDDARVGSVVEPVRVAAHRHLPSKHVAPAKAHVNYWF